MAQLVFALTLEVGLLVPDFLILGSVGKQVSTFLKSAYGLWYLRDGLGEAYDGDIAFANALETFGGGHDDPISVAVGGFFFYTSFLL